MSDASGQSKYVTLISSDGFEFVVLREAVLVSSTIKGMLDPKSECLCELLEESFIMFITLGISVMSDRMPQYRPVCRVSYGSLHIRRN
jgi:hypothetical protein